MTKQQVMIELDQLYYIQGKLAWQKSLFNRQTQPELVKALDAYDYQIDEEILRLEKLYDAAK